MALAGAWRRAVSPASRAWSIAAADPWRHQQQLPFAPSRGMADVMPVQVREPGDPLPRADTRIVTAVAVDEDGRRHTVRALAGQSLYRALVNAGLRTHLSHQLDTSCYGYVCRVSISDDWRAKIPEPNDDEQYVLQHHFTPPDFDPSIRCSCKIKLNDGINGIVVALVPEKCWDFT